MLVNCNYKINESIFPINKIKKTQEIQNGVWGLGSLYG